MNTEQKILIRALVEFVGLLRKAGLKLGPDITLKATQALAVMAPATHQDLYWTLYACMVTNQDQTEIFNQVFALYWGHAKLPDSALAVSLPRSKIKNKGEKQFSKRTLDAFKKQSQPMQEPQTDIELLKMSWSDREHLQHMDFDSMSSEEYLKAQKLLSKLNVLFKPVTTRRSKKSLRPRQIDFRATFKHSARLSGQFISLKYKKPKTYYPAVLMLIDISGSMSRYAQIMLQFAYLLNKSRSHVHVFVFATRLDCVSAELGKGDIDEALERIGNKVEDFNSGTRIGECIKAFNYNYLKRTINSKSEVLLVSDGLDRGDACMLNQQMGRLKRSCKRLIWLNPLLRYHQYQPKAKGASTIFPYADLTLSVHNLASIEQLINVLDNRSRPPVLKVA